LEALLAGSPQHVLGREYLALTHLALGLDGEALAGFEAVTQARPDSGVAWHNLSLALRRTGQVEEALEAARSAGLLEPGRSEVQYNLAVLLDLANHPREALAAFQKWLEMAPQDPKAPVIREHVEELQSHLQGAVGP